MWVFRWKHDYTAGNLGEVGLNAEEVKNSGMKSDTDLLLQSSLNDAAAEAANALHVYCLTSEEPDHVFKCVFVLKACKKKTGRYEFEKNRHFRFRVLFTSQPDTREITK